MSKSARLAMALVSGLGMLLALALAWALVMGRDVVLADDQPDGSTIVSPQTTDGTWGPGTITAMADVVINAGVAITIAPGTTIRVADGVGFTVNGDLHSDGPATFTAISGSPGAWDGITYAPGSSGYLNGTTIEYATHALTLNTANPIVVSNSHLRHNRHQTSGGDMAYGAGLYIVQGAHQIEDTRIYDNAATASGTGQVRGAGVYIAGGGPRILNSWVYENVATGNRAGAGGGIALAGGSAAIEGSHVTTNTLAGGGDGQLKSGGGIGFAGYTSAVIRGNWIAGNRNALSDGYAGGGGIGFGNGSSASLIEGNVIHANYIQGPDWCEGGGIDTWDTTNSVVIRNNLILSNTSGTCRSGYGAYGGGVNANGSATGVHVVNNTIVGNQAARGGGIYLQGGTVFAINNVVANNVASNRGGGIQRDVGTADFNDLYGNTAPSGANWNGTVGGNNTSVGPMFLGTGDMVQQYHLHAWSPAINGGTNSATGLPADDYDGQPRPLYGGWDMGFDEVAPAFAVTKIAAPDRVRPGETIHYTIVVANAGQGDATGLAVTDPLPANTSYVVGSSQVTMPVLQSQTYRDELVNVAYNGSNGTLDWSGEPWIEVGDDGNPNGGDVRVVDDMGSRRIRILNSGKGVMRTADLSTFTSARLTFAFRRYSFDGDTDYVRVEVSSNGGSSWTELARIGGQTTDSGYKLASYDLTGYASARTVIRFLSSGLGSSDYFHIDNVQIEDIAYRVFTNPGGAPPALVGGATLNAGQRMTISYAIRVDDSVPAGVEEIANVVDLTSAQGITATGRAVTALDAAPDLALTKEDGNITATPGSVVVYTLSYANNGDQGATGVVLTETVPAHATFRAASSTGTWSCADGSPGGTVCTLAIGGIDAGDSDTAAFAVTVNAPVPAGVEAIVNAASIADDGSNGADLTPGDNSDGEVTPVEAAPDLALSKDDEGITTTPGSAITYTLSYANDGDQDATGVAISETVPAHTAFDAARSTPGWSCADGSPAGTTCTFAVGSLPAGGGAEIAFAVAVTNPLPAGVEAIVNAASIADDGANGVDPRPDDNQAGDTTPVQAAPDLSLNKDDGGVAVLPGRMITYTLSYANHGNQGASGVTITETVPAHTAFDAAHSTPGWSCADGSPAGTVCTFTAGDLAGGGAGTVLFVVQVDDSLPVGVDQIANAASIADDGANGDDGNAGDNQDDDTTPVVGAAPDLVVVKSDGGIMTLPGHTIAYSLSYANRGNQDTTGVAITETVPAHTTFDAANSSYGWVCVPDGNAGAACTLAVGDLPAGNSGSATFAVTVVDPLPDSVDYILNVVSIADDGASGADLNPNDNQDQETTEVAYTPVLSIAKEGPDTARVGERVVYTFTVSHAPDSDGSPVSDVTVQDDVAGQAVYVGGDGGEDGLLQVGESWIYTASHTVQSSDPDPLVNKATVTARDRNGNLVTASDIHETDIRGALPGGYLVFLPIVAQRLEPVLGSGPDLVVESVTVMEDNVQVVIKNQGRDPATDPFWVDLYVDPDPVPTQVNQVWNDGRSAQGIVWGVGGGVALPLDPGESLTLTFEGPYYWPSLSDISWPLPAGAAIYVQVDSANTDTTYGAVLESHEMAGGRYNNIYGPAFRAASATSQGAAEIPSHAPVLVDRLPPRP